MEYKVGDRVFICLLDEISVASIEYIHDATYRFDIGSMTFYNVVDSVLGIL